MNRMYSSSLSLLWKSRITILAHLVVLGKAQSAVELPGPNPTTTTDCHRFSRTGFWQIDIDNGPVLAPSCLPPFSRNSDRDRSHLPYQISAIIASYVACATIIGVGILVVRKERRKLLDQFPIELKLVNNESRKFSDSILGSPRSITTWMRNPLKRKTGTSLFSHREENENAHGSALGGRSSIGSNSILSFDAKILAADESKRNTEMEKIYATIMTQDITSTPQRTVQPRSNNGSVRSLSRSGQVPTLADTMPRTSLSQGPANRSLPQRLHQFSQQDLRGSSTPIAIYPPEYNMAASPISPSSSVCAKIPEDFWSKPGIGSSQADDRSKSRLQDQQRTRQPITPVLIVPGMKMELPDDMYPASPLPGQRCMRFPGQKYPMTSPHIPYTPISPGPMSSALCLDTSGLGRAELPNDMYPATPASVSTRMVFPNPIRPGASPRSFVSRSGSTISKSSRARTIFQNLRVNTGEKDSDFKAEDRSPLTHNFPSVERMKQYEPTSPDTPESTDNADRFETLSRGVPTEPMSRLASPVSARRVNLKIKVTNTDCKQSAVDPTSATTEVQISPAPSSLRRGPPLTLRTLQTASQVTSSAPPDDSGSPASVHVSKPLPFRVAFSQTSKFAQTPVKTTFLEPKKQLLHRGMLSARTPGTAIPQTPYSAYMPFTPMTPVTPRLMSKQDRKQRRKEVKKTLMTENDLVKEEEEEWE